MLKLIITYAICGCLTAIIAMFEKYHKGEFAEIFSDKMFCTNFAGWFDLTPVQHSNICTSDQKVKADAGKPKLSLVPRRIIWDIAAIREYGNNKYPDGGPDNWKEVNVERYRDAAYRHFMHYLDDPNGVDKESGLPHLWHLACNIAFLCELEEERRKDNGL